MQKGVFLLQESGSPGWRGLYEYEPWDWGMFSRALSRDVDSMVWSRLLELEEVPWRRYPRYRCSRKGELEAEHTLASMSADERRFVRQVRAYVTSRSFSQLLREIYAAYPGWDGQSRFRG